MKNTQSRRQFLRTSNCAAIGTVTALNTMLNMRMAGSAAAQSGANDYKALVCIYLAGGNDSYNMVVPRTASEYATYASSRSNLAHSQGDLLPINISNTPGRTFGLHPSMPEVQSLINAGNMAVIANVGTLVEPTTISQYDDESVVLPKSLFSHNDQRDHWQTSYPQAKYQTGWFGRASDLLHDVINSGASTAIPMNISLSGNNIIQVGDQTGSYSTTSNGAVSLSSAVANTNRTISRHNGTVSLMEQKYQNLLTDVFAEENAKSIALAGDFNTAFENSTVNTAFPASSLGGQLKAIAQTIGAQGTLGLRRQTFFINWGAFDNHTDLASDHADLMEELSQALAAFYASLEELGVENDVTTFTTSEFGRTLRSNGQGSDHAWGGNSLVMGGAVDGGKMYGQYPTSLGLGTGLDAGTNGRILPTTSCDLYFAELMRWFGVQAGDMETVLPNLQNFYDPYSATNPLGFL